ncbi:MAG: DUF1778 domain-containing protein [Acidimicrobiia bacterium]|nr:DUF1778 domain-containing protein [Acidimicrobiia bacterium]NNC75311.1 DUF1778 domain-containing protein [Acidimicrobiia bacterium]
MDVTGAITRLEATVTGQLQLAGEDPAVEAAGEALLAALGPALRQAAMSLAEQAAAEVASQLPEATIKVVLEDGDPTLDVQTIETEAPAYNAKDLHARLTLRLSDELKGLVEDAATETGDSVNAYVIRALSSVAARPSGKQSAGSRLKGTIES